MKKIFLILCLICLQLAFAREDMPVIPTNGSYNVQYIEDSSALINVDNMRRKDKIEQAKNEAAKKSPAARIQFDKKQIIEQRVLDYMNQQNNTLLPVL